MWGSIEDHTLIICFTVAGTVHFLPLALEITPLCNLTASHTHITTILNTCGWSPRLRYEDEEGGEDRQAKQSLLYVAKA